MLSVLSVNTKQDLKFKKQRKLLNRDGKYRRSERIWTFDLLALETRRSTTIRVRVSC
jgi:hypothetical protein